jgi:hypothetical protein
LPLEPRAPPFRALDDREGASFEPTIPAHLRRYAQSIRAGDNVAKLRGLGFRNFLICDRQ